MQVYEYPNELIKVYLRMYFAITSLLQVTALQTSLDEKTTQIQNLTGLVQSLQNQGTIHEIKYDVRLFKMLSWLFV